MRCKTSEPWDKAYSSKYECCKANNGDTGCSLGPSARGCWVPMGRSACRSVELGACNLPIVRGFSSQEECLASYA